ncbi:MAG: radical SAM protein [Candidatus Heimdallarchaeaceae archaeon]
MDSLSCEQRELDTQRIINYLITNDIELTKDINECDYAIFVTCAVDKLNEKQCIERIKDIKTKLPESSKLIIGGCLPSISPKKIPKDIYTTFSPTSLHILDRVFSNNIHTSILKIKSPNRSIFDLKKKTTHKTARDPRNEYDLAKKGYKIVIDQGCLLRCSYCMIKKAIGNLHSIPIDEVKKQFEQAILQKEPTIMLMGGDVGAYGIDIGTNFTELLDELSVYNGNYKIFIHDFNVNWLIKDLNKYLTIFSNNKRIYSICFPIQSGSDKILKLMKRPYTAKDVKYSLKTIKKNFPSILLGTHIIIGFPGENDDDFLLTVKLLKEIDFDFISCFQYSEHETAISARLPNKVPAEIVNKRLREISKYFREKVKIYTT